MPYEDEGWGEAVKDQIHDLKEQGPLVGIYRGYEVVKNDLGESRLHKFDCDGVPVKVWGKTHLNRLLDGRNGELVKVALTGETVSMGPGKNPMIEFVLWSKGRQDAPPLPSAPLPTTTNGGGQQDFQTAP